jgi:hypothetical protein
MLEPGKTLPYTTTFEVFIANLSGWFFADAAGLRFSWKG